MTNKSNIKRMLAVSAAAAVLILCAAFLSPRSYAAEKKVTVNGFDITFLADDAQNTATHTTYHFENEPVLLENGWYYLGQIDYHVGDKMNLNVKVGSDQTMFGSSEYSFQEKNHAKDAPKVCYEWANGTGKWSDSLRYYSEPEFTTMQAHWLVFPVYSKLPSGTGDASKCKYYCILVNVEAPIELDSVEFTGTVGTDMTADKKSALTGNQKSRELAEISLDEAKVKELEDEYGLKVSAVKDADNNVNVSLSGTPTKKIENFEIPFHAKAEYTYCNLAVESKPETIPTARATSVITINVTDPEPTPTPDPEPEPDPESVKVDPPVSKTVAGEKPSADSKFDFVFKADDPAYPMPDDSIDGEKKASVTGSGEVEFGTIEYKQPGTYTYTCYEVNSGIEGYTYDETVFKMKVEVTRVGNHLEAARTITRPDGSTDYDMEFVNVYKAPKVLDKKEDDKGRTKDDDNDNKHISGRDDRADGGNGNGSASAGKNGRGNGTGRSGFSIVRTGDETGPEAPIIFAAALCGLAAAYTIRRRKKADR